MPCKVPGCTRRHEARGLCALHYVRSKKGIPLTAPVRQMSVPFWERVDTSQGLDECWGWNGARDRLGYGLISKKRFGEASSHRYVMRLAGIDVSGLHVLHICDNPPCCNPLHLMVGTHQENMRQAVDRNRMATGENHPGTFLTWEDVREIRAMAATGIKQRAIAKKFSIGQSQISRIVRNVVWKEVG